MSQPNSHPSVKSKCLEKTNAEFCNFIQIRHNHPKKPHFGITGKVEVSPISVRINSYKIPFYKVITNSYYAVTPTQSISLLGDRRERRNFRVQMSTYKTMMTKDKSIELLIFWNKC